MNTVMFVHALRSLRGSVLGFGAGMFLYGLFSASGFQAARANQEVVARMVSSYPPAMRAAFGLDRLGEFPGFMSARYLSLVWPLLIASFAVAAGSRVVAQEIERGTAELWLSVPVSRTRLLASKLAALAVATAALVGVSAASMALAQPVAHGSYPAGGLAAVSVTMLLFALSIGAIAALCSSLARDRGRAAGVASAVLLGSYAAFVASNSSPRLAWMSKLSIFAAFRPQLALEQGSVNLAHALALALVVLACWAGSLVVFARRDAA